MRRRELTERYEELRAQAMGKSGRPVGVGFVPAALDARVARSVVWLHTAGNAWP